MPATRDPERLELIRRAVQDDYRNFFANVCGVRWDRNKDTGWCGYHEDVKHPSFSVTFPNNRLHWKCFANCGDPASGDVFDAYQRARNLPPGRDGFGFAIAELEEMYGLGEAPAKPVEKERLAGVQWNQLPPQRSGKGGRGSSMPKDARCVATYPYPDEHGYLLYEVRRFEWEEDGERQKSFRQRRPDPQDVGKWKHDTKGIRRVPYRLPEIKDSPFVVFVEGEQDAETLVEWGFPGTCIAGGASSWHPRMAQYFAGKCVAFIADRDRAGDGFRDEACSDIVRVAKWVKTWKVPLPWREKGGPDITDWKEQGGTKEELKRLLKAEWRDFAIQAEGPTEPEHIPRPTEEDPGPRPQKPETGSEGEDAPALDRIILPLVNTLQGPESATDRLIAVRRQIDKALLEAGELDRRVAWKKAVEFWDDPEDPHYIDQGFRTGLPGLDGVLWGIRPGWTSIEGDSGLGKSTFASMLLQAAIEDEVCAGYIPLEEPPQALRVMMLARISRVDGRTIACDNYNEMEESARTSALMNVKEAVAKLLPLEEFLWYPDERCFPITNEVLTELIEQFAEFTKGREAIFFVDPIHAVAMSREDNSEYDKNMMSIDLVLGAGRRYGWPVVTTAHMNKLGIVKGGTQFLHSASVRIKLGLGDKKGDKGRVKEWNEDLSDEELGLHPWIDLRVAKNKGLPTARRILRYDKRVATFTEHGSPPDSSIGTETRAAPALPPELKEREAFLPYADD